MAKAILTEDADPIDKFLDITEESYSDDDSISVDDYNNEYLVTMDKNTNLHFSSATGNISDMKADLEIPQLKIDAENYMGWTPLMFAVRNGHIEAVKLLLEKGADVTKKNKMGVNIFNLSVADGQLELMDIVLRHMLKGGISRNRIQENLSPISLAVIFKRPHLLKYLLGQGFNIDASTWKTDLTPLMFAAAVESDKIITLLSVKGADQKAKNYMGVTYQELLVWRQNGLEFMAKGGKPKTKLTLPHIEMNGEKDVSETVTTIPIVVKTASPKPNQNKNTPIIAKNSISVNPQAKEFVPQKHGAVKKVLNRNSDGKNKENALNASIHHHPPPAKYVGPSRPKKDRKFVPPLPRNESPFIHHAFQYQSPYNGLPCPMYMPVLNSPYGGPVPSPVTPMMVPSPFPNFLAAIGDMPQNSPINMVQTPHMPFHPNGPPQMFFASPMARPDHHYGYDPNMGHPHPNGYPASPMCFAVLPNAPYHLPGPAH